MVVHIVMVKFKEDCSQEQIVDIKNRLEQLVAYIKPLKSMEVGLNFKASDRAMDLVLTATFDTKEGLEIYSPHPAHQEVVKSIKEFGEYTKVVDYEK
ncbi:MAG TPA: Dabb family protein [Nitratifractor sp.]|nr:Dabb family protein [Nitratifractor sp.]HHH20644.1 Dabb family protein [Nitratifractor sp.]